MKMIEWLEQNPQGEMHPQNEESLKRPAVPDESPSTRQTGRFISNLQYLAG
jgi:hypothetical protein